MTNSSENYYAEVTRRAGIGTLASSSGCDYLPTSLPGRFPVDVATIQISEFLCPQSQSISAPAPARLSRSDS